MTRHLFELHHMGDTWCKHCNTTLREIPGMHTDPLDRNTLHDYVVSHGLGTPTREAYQLGRKLIASGDDYATAAHEIIARGLIKERN